MHVIITGGSSGIGLALARRYLARGASVTILGRSRERLEAAVLLLRAELPGTSERLYAAEADVRDQASLTSAVGDASETFGPCDLLITSAGFVDPIPFDRLDGAQFAAQVETNLIGTANSVRCVYSGMKARGRGSILMISSGAALIGIYGYTAYCASKSALVGFAEALRMEAEPHGIHVAICYPPDTDTPQLAGELPFRSPQAALVMGRVRPWPADKVAERIERLLARRARAIYFGPSLSLLARFGPMVKPALYWWFLRSAKRLG
ncbi:SDR family oxidoreductase [Pseudomonas sp. R2.Fl]|nr:SDR family oxidoreductase [Pseudomonas sp. R2.Fl]